MDKYQGKIYDKYTKLFKIINIYYTCSISCCILMQIFENFDLLTCDFLNYRICR